MLRPLRSLAPLCFAALVLAAAPAFAQETPACSASHEMRDGEMRLRADCPVPLVDSSRALTELLREKYPGGRMTDDRATIEIGRIVYHPWLSKSLAEAAVRSPVWDPKRGSGRSGNQNGAVESMIDARKLLQPWQPVFLRFGARARVASVEKVLVGKVGKTPELAAIPQNDATKGLELPFDALLWIRLEPLPAGY